MKKYLVLYNPLAKKGKGQATAEKLAELFKDAEVVFRDLTAVEDLGKLMNETPEETEIVFSGGDGTLNRVINMMDKAGVTRKVLYYAAGTGNDFMNDLNKPADAEPFAINEYLEGLPTVRVNDITCKFINGIGFGLDGYCCEESDRLHALGKSKSYTLIAAEGLLGKYKPTNATVTLDGVTRTYERVYMAPTMFGRFFGGGVQITPHQDRKDPKHQVTNVIVHGVSRVKALMIFLKVVAGKGDRYPQYLDYHVCDSAKVVFDRPTALQIDGETVTNVLSYEVESVNLQKH